jgi:hypothetical protein
MVRTQLVGSPPKGHRHRGRRHRPCHPQRRARNRPQNRRAARAGQRVPLCHRHETLGERRAVPPADASPSTAAADTPTRPACPPPSRSGSSADTDACALLDSTGDIGDREIHLATSVRFSRHANSQMACWLEYMRARGLTAPRCGHAGGRRGTRRGGHDTIAAESGGRSGIAPGSPRMRNQHPPRQHLQSDHRPHLNRLRPITNARRPPARVLRHREVGLRRSAYPMDKSHPG